jgi:hypothetical protein
MQFQRLDDTIFRNTVMFLSDILFELWTISHLHMNYDDYVNRYFLSHMANKDKQFEMVNTT